MPRRRRRRQRGLQPRGGGPHAARGRGGKGRGRPAPRLQGGGRRRLRRLRRPRQAAQRRPQAAAAAAASAAHDVAGAGKARGRPRGRWPARLGADVQHSQRQARLRDEVARRPVERQEREGAHGAVAGPHELRGPRGRPRRLRRRQPRVGARRRRVRGGHQRHRRQPPHAQQVQGPRPLPRARALPVAGRPRNAGGDVQRHPRERGDPAAHLQGQGAGPWPLRHLVVRAGSSPSSPVGRLGRSHMGRRLADGGPRLCPGLSRPRRVLRERHPEAMDREREAAGQAARGLLHGERGDGRAASVHDLRGSLARRLHARSRDGSRLARLADARHAPDGARLPDDAGRDGLGLRRADPGRRRCRRPGPARRAEAAHARRRALRRRHHASRHHCPLRVRAVLPRRALGRRGRGVAPRRADGCGAAPRLGRRPAERRSGPVVLGEQAALLHHGDDFLQLPLHLWLSAGHGAGASLQAEGRRVPGGLRALSAPDRQRIGRGGGAAGPGRGHPQARVLGRRHPRPRGAAGALRGAAEERRPIAPATPRSSRRRPSRSRGTRRR